MEAREHRLAGSSRPARVRQSWRTRHVAQHWGDSRTTPEQIFRFRGRKKDVLRVWGCCALRFPTFCSLANKRYIALDRSKRDSLGYGKELATTAPRNPALSTAAFTSPEETASAIKERR